MDRLLLLSAAMLFAGAAAPALADGVADIAPTGKLRLGIAISPAPGPFWAGRDAKTGELRGVTIDLGRAMADKLKLPLELVIFDNSGAITEAGPSGAWDVTFVPMDAARMKKIDFGPVYNIGESTFLVRAGAPIETLQDVDRPGQKIVGVSDTTTIRAIGAWLTHTSVEGVATVEDILERMRKGDADAFGMSREALLELSKTLPGSRVLPGYFFQTKTAVAVPKGRAASLAFVSDFMEAAKKSGLIRKAFDDNGLANQQVAP